MVLVIQSIEIENGNCRYCIKGEDGTENLYNFMRSHVDQLCKLFRRENTKSIILTDYDSLYNYSEQNEELIETLDKSTDIPFWLYSDFSSVEKCKKFFDKGIYRILINKLCIIDPEGVRELVSALPTKIAVVFQAENRIINFPELNKSFTDNDFISIAKGLGINRIVYFDKSWDNSENGTNFELLKEICIKNQVKITVGNGVNNPQKLHEMNAYQPFGLDSVIISKPLYENNFACQKIWRLAEAEEENIPQE